MGFSQIYDFDVRITEVSLLLSIPKNMIVNDPIYKEYLNGRKIWGLVFSDYDEVDFHYKDGTVDRLRAGGIGLVPPTASYHYIVPEDCTLGSNYVANIHISGELEDILDSCKACILYPKDPSHFHRMFEECISLWKKREPGYKMLVTSHLYQMLYDFLFIRMHEHLDTYSWHQTRPAQEYILSHYAENITLEQLAEMCGLSVTHFRRLFKQVYNESPITYLLNHRLARAKDLLLSQQFSLSTIAEQTGFQNASYFIRFFKRHTGLTPQRWRRQL